MVGPVNPTQEDGPEGTTGNGRRGREDVSVVPGPESQRDPKGSKEVPEDVLTVGAD